MTGVADYPKLAQQPLSLVLAEIRFSTVKKIADYIPDLQERLRKAYPAYREVHAHQFQLSPQGVEAGEQTISWVFLNPDTTKAIEVDGSRLIYFCSAYERFPRFQAECVDALRALKEVVDPGLLHRIGLRYNDLVVPRDGETLADYLLASLIPASEVIELGGPMLQHRTETLVRTAAGVLGLRTLSGHLSEAVFADLRGRIPVTVRRDVDANRVSAILDFDHFWEDKQGVAFDLEIGEGHLDSLHEVAREAFWRVTTDFARRERWA